MNFRHRFSALAGLSLAVGLANGADPPLAPFLGNLTTIVSSGNLAILARETNCSLSFYNGIFNFSGLSFTASSLGTVPDYELLLNKNAFLTTTPDQFKNGCVDPTIGVPSRTGVFGGRTKSGLLFGAAALGSVTAAPGSIESVTFTAGGALVSSATLDVDQISDGIVAGDLNGDGVNDIVSVNEGSITVFLTKPDGTLQNGINYDLPVTPSSFYTGASAVIDDVNNDGNLDIVLATVDSNLTNAVWIFLGNGNGALKAPLMFTTKQYAVGLITGDFNGDGKKDLITGEGQVYLGQGNGKFTQLGQSIFQSIDYGNLRYTFAVGDFNHDGKIDLAAANGGSVMICLGNGDGAFTLGATYLTNGNADLLATDLDGDGNLDLYAGLANGGIFSGDYPGILSLGSGYALMGKGDGTFSGVPVLPFTFTFPGQTVSSAGSFGPLSGPGNVVDLNKDGKLDVLSTEGALDANNRPVFALVGYLGRGDGTFMTGPSTGILSPDLNSFAIADFNGDGLPDVAYLVGTGYYVAFGNGDGSFKPGIFTAAPSFYSNQQDYGESLTNLTSADFNHDGKADLMYFVHDSNFSANGPINVIAEAAIQLGNGDGTFRAPILVPLSGGNSPYTSQAYTLPSLIGDVSGDGIPDLLVLQYTGVSYPILSNTDYGTQLAVYLGNGDGTFKAPLIAQTAENPTVQLLADMNGDGKLDLVALGDHYGVNYLNSSSELAVSLGNGNGTFQMPVIYAEKFDASASYSGNLESENLLAADFNGDGKMDLLNGGSVYLGNGDGTLQITSGTEPTQILEVGSDYGFVYAGDFNNDGKPDLLWSNVLLLNEYPGKSSGGGGPVLLSNLTITSQGPVYNRGTKLFSVTVTLTNNTAAAVSGPIEVAFNNLPVGVTLTDSAGNSPAGAPFLSVASGLAVGASATFGAQFSDPSNTPIPISLSIYSGSF